MDGDDLEPLARPSISTGSDSGYDLSEFRHARQETTDRWDPLAPTPPSVHHESPLSRPDSRSSTIRQTESLDDRDEPHFSRVGLGISRARTPEHRRGISHDYFGQDSPRHPGTPKSPYQVHEALLATTPGSQPSPGYRDGSPIFQHPGPGPPRRGSRWAWFDSRLIMYGLLLLGIIFAASHHAFYANLAGKPADDQLKMMRFGTLLAYVAKSALVSAVIFAYRQQIWATVKRKILQLGTIDSLFAATDDVTAIANWEFARKAKVALGLAIVSWLYPLTVILTPATLTVAPLTETQITQCPAVRTLNFEAEKVKNWRKQIRINNFPGIPLSLWNCTLPNSVGVTDPFNETFFDYWTGSTWQTSMLSTLSTYANRVVPRDNASLETCGLGWNCSYTVSFTAPGYKCESVARGRNDNTDKLAQLGSPFDTTDLLPDGSYSYIAHGYLGDYYPIQIDAGDGGVPNMPPPFPNNLGAFRTEPVLWIGHSDWTDTDRLPPLNRSASDSSWNTSYIPSVFRCEHYVTDYRVQFNHSMSDMTTTILHKTYRHRVMNTTFVPGVDAIDGTKDNITATPMSNYISPLNLETYRLTAAYHSLGLQMRYNINGSIRRDSFVFANTEAMKTRLINKSTYLVVPNFMEKIQSFYENIILSLLANPQFIVVSWAAQPNRLSGVGNESTYNDPDLLYPCTKTRVRNAYAYNVRDLWIVYTFAILSAVVSVTLGTAALAQNNNHIRDIRLSSIVAATRAPCLEDLPWKSSKWGEVPPEIRKTRMGYGIITDDATTETPKSSLRNLRLGATATTGSATSSTSARVYYGFAPEEVIKRGQNPAVKRTQTSVLSFRHWEGS
ncbi:hypothetical protein B0H63DRAFT_463906 [Podospora didyma]|uniref:Formylmethionine deformylase-like protein n=1 Tax=Podospora didyma TaxID=330526 RepID=A0AAE0NXB8_9PEZI|nr:hypothetical protein B0H63DRAFT_463906 [Podospora didyma]